MGSGDGLLQRDRLLHGIDKLDASLAGRWKTIWTPSKRRTRTDRTCDQKAPQDVQKGRRTRQAGTRAAASEEARRTRGTRCAPRCNGSQTLSLWATRKQSWRTFSTSC